MKKVVNVGGAVEVRMQELAAETETDTHHSDRHRVAMHLRSSCIPSVASLD